MMGVDYTDDKSIVNDTQLLRRVPSKPNLNVIWDENLNCWRPSSASFEDHRNGTPMSIVLSDTLMKLNRPLESALGSHEKDFSLVAFTAGVARDNGQKVARDPTEDEPAHGVVVGKKTRGVRKKLAKDSKWIVAPDLTPPTK